MTTTEVTPEAGTTGPVLPFAGAIWPKGAKAWIRKADRSVTTSGRARAKGWHLTFERRSPPVLEPLMGWIGEDDPLAQIELEFPTLEAAICYAEGQGLDYEVLPPPGASERERTLLSTAARIFAEATLERLRLRWLQGRYGQDRVDLAERGDPVGEDTWSDPMDVVADPRLSLDAKRSILMNWAWSEHLIDLATAEGMPDRGQPSRLAEVEQALLVLEGRRSAPMANQGQPRLAA